MKHKLLIFGGLICIAIFIIEVNAVLKSNQYFGIDALISIISLFFILFVVWRVTRSPSKPQPNAEGLTPIND